jgi:hypothetical protein
MANAWENPSICIPRIFNTIPKKRVIEVFNALKLGSIEDVAVHIGRNFQRVFIHFQYWYNSEFAQSIKKRLLGGEELKIIYNDPWFWKCRLNNSKHQTSSQSSGNYISKYNTRNQIIALKDTLTKERDFFKKALNEKENRISDLEKLLTLCMGDEALLRRKHIQQRLRYTREHYLRDSSGILFTT